MGTDLNEVITYYLRGRGGIWERINTNEPIPEVESLFSQEMFEVDSEPPTPDVNEDWEQMVLNGV